MNSQIATTREAQRAARRNGYLVRYTITVLLNLIAEWAVPLGVLVYALDQGGPTAAGLASIAIIAPYLLAAPIAGSLAERYRPQAVRFWAMGVQILGFATGALAAYAELETAFVVAPVMIALAGATTLGPAGAVLRPAIVRSSRELTVANLWVAYAASISVFAGPLTAAGALAIGGPELVIAACAVVAALAAAIAAYRRPIDPPGGSDLTDRIGAISLMRRDLRTVAHRPGVIGLLVAAGGQFFLIGALELIIVVAAEDELGLGPSGPGLLTAALGAGAVASAAVSTMLLRRQTSIAHLMVITLSLIAIGSLLLGAALSVVAALLLLPLLGLTRAVHALLGVVLLQRSAEPEVLGSLFAALALTTGIALILGSVTAQVAIAVSGARAALVVTGLFFVILLVSTARSVAHADASADVPVVAMSLLRRTPLFEPLPRAALEVVGRAVVEVPVEAGEQVITQGEPGDRFYAVSDGEFLVTVDDREVARCVRGDAFGELALLADAPRAATVTALTHGTLLAIDRSPFLIAVTGHDSTRQAAWGVMHRLDVDPVELPDLTDTADARDR